MELSKKTKVIQMTARDRLDRHYKGQISHIMRVPDDAPNEISDFIKKHHDEVIFANMLYKNTKTYALKKEIVESLFQDKESIKIQYNIIRNMMDIYPISQVENNPNFYVVRLRFLIYEGSLNFPLIYRGPSSKYDDVGLDIYFRPQKLYYIKKHPRFILHDYIDNLPQSSHLKYWRTVKHDNYVTIVYEIHLNSKLTMKQEYQDRYSICTNQNNLKEIVNNNPSLFSDRVMMHSFKLSNDAKILL